MLPLLANLAPFAAPGGSILLGWLLTFVLIAAVVWLVVYVVTKFAGPPTLPEGARWIIWVIVAIALLVFIFAALGIHLP